MAVQEVDFQKTTAAVLKEFSPEFTDLIVNVLLTHNTVFDAPDGKTLGTYVDVRHGHGLMVVADDKEPCTMTTEFLVPSNELAASYMVIWRKWCDKRDINSKDALLSLMNRVVTDMKKHITQDNQDSNSDLAIGLMGAVLDNYPEIIASMQWSVDNGHAPCLVIANDNNLVRCGICYGGTYMTPEIELQVSGS